MVSNKRLRYTGFNGFHAPVVPKAPRSIRKTLHKKSSSGSEICPFELLAAVAGKLLQESEGSASSSSPQQKEQISILEDYVKQEPLEDKHKPVKSKDLDHGSCAESQFVDLKLEPPLKDLPQSDNDSGLEHASVVTTSDFLKEVSTNVKLEASDIKNGVIGTPSHGDLCDANMDTNIPKLQTESIEKQSQDLQDSVKPHVNGVVLNKSYSSVHVPFYSNVKIGIRDDDENCFSYNSNKMKAFRFQSRRRIRKVLTSKYWKTAPKLKDYDLPNTTCGGVRPFNYNKKKIYKRERCETDGFFRKRKLFHQSSKPDYIQDTSSESISNSPQRSDSEDKRHPSKTSIKSFKVPELYLEMPETSTIGSLKRTVMEAMTAILGGELHIGVLVQGKKVRDDNITLQQTGISLNSDTLGFMLEPNLPEPSEKQPPMSPHHDNPQPPPMSPGSLFTDVGLSNSSSLDNQVEQKNESQEEIVEDTKAIVPIAIVNPEALAVVPLNNKPNKRSELSQRRTRRPFSVSEVEALVEAVETLGTGRWRDVKIRAFDDANHRTYVDLKDKWKTLVHTASIAPQQRRGEPVPQDLLDRVLAAHGFWTQHQSKQNGKNMAEPVQTLGTLVKV